MAAEEAKKGKTRRLACAITGGLFLAVSLQWGRQLDRAGNVNFLSLSGWAAVLLSWVLFTPLVYGGFCALSAGCRRLGQRDRIRPVYGKTAAAAPRRLAGRALLLFLAWMPVFLAVYPGFFSYDATDELEEVLTGTYITRHPLLHVLLLGRTVAGLGQAAGDYNIGIAVYVLAQMAGMAFLLSWFLLQLERLGAGKLFTAMALLYFAVFPVIPMYVLCTSKDMPYTAGMLMAVTILCRRFSPGIDAAGKGKRGFWPAALCAAFFVVGTFRSNGFYVLLAAAPLLLLFAPQKERKRLAALCLTALLLCVGTREGLAFALHPADTDPQEAFTVPIQQLARAWKYSPNILDEQGQEALFEILPQEALSTYTPKLSDPVKAGFQTRRFLEAPGRYIGLWARIGLRAPFTYLNAWLMTSYGFWYPFTVIDVYNGYREYKTSSYFSCETEPPGVRHSMFPLLEGFYQEISWREEFHRIPLLSWLFSPGFFCWVYVLGALYLFSEKRGRVLAALSPIYLNWLTVLLGPACLVRYVLIFWFAFPLLPVVIKSQMCYTAMDNGESGKVCPSDIPERRYEP